MKKDETLNENKPLNCEERYSRNKGAFFIQNKAPKLGLCKKNSYLATV